MAAVTIIGGHGKIALILARVLSSRGDAVTSWIRNPEHAADVAATGAKPLVMDVEHASREEIAAALAGADGFIGKPVESLARFQHAILSNLPADARPTGLRLVVDDTIVPDSGALRDDLAHVAEVLAAAADTTAIDYIARFLAGVARSARDEPLEKAASALARDHSAGRALAADLARISGLVQDRLAAAGA